ncbi:MAG TPA: hypothetical protein VMV79_02060 [Alphaproteobacteria bacterium]|nr:hypothetical protein [Alphaproteobacteria bacterium]
MEDEDNEKLQTIFFEFVCTADEVGLDQVEDVRQAFVDNHPQYERQISEFASAYVLEELSASEAPAEMDTEEQERLIQGALAGARALQELNIIRQKIKRDGKGEPPSPK